MSYLKHIKKGNANCVLKSNKKKKKTLNLKDLRGNSFALVI